jgi:class 3 adenylate cyclase
MAADDDLVWTGWFARVARPMSPATVRAAGTALALLFGFGALAVAPFVAGWVELEGLNRGGMTGLLVGAVAMSTWILVAVRRIPDERITALVPPLVVFVAVAANINLSFIVVFSGPQFGIAAVYFAEVPVIAFFLMRRPWAVGLTAASMAGYACALVILNEPPAPVEQFVIMLSSAVATGVLVGSMASRLDESRRAERRAKVELAELNQHLEHRVAEQVDDLERAGRLRRFLAPQVAEVVTSAGADELLAPHRCDVAVFFVDLRGFTSFTNAVEPEHIVFVLGDYYDAVGSVLERYDATIGGFDGDGVMAYIGDPVPRPDAATEAVAMAREIATTLDGRVSKWSMGDHRLGYGIGLAFGTATLGVVGYEGRYDYTPVGAVVNLAARLCADAADREIVVDQAFCDAAQLAGAVRPRDDVDLKGFGVVATYAVGH